MPPPPGGGQAANSAATVNNGTSFRYNRNLCVNFVGGEGASHLGMVHIESSIVLMVLEVYRVRSRISSVGALPNDIADVVRAKVTSTIRI